MVALNHRQNRNHGDNETENEIDGDEEDIQLARWFRGVIDVQKNNCNERYDVKCGCEKYQTEIMDLTAIFTSADPIFIPTRD